MFKVVLKFVLPVTVAGAGGATAFGPSSKNPQPVTSNPVIIQDSPSQAEVTLPLISQPDLPVNTHISEDINIIGPQQIQQEAVPVETPFLSPVPEHIEETSAKFEATTTGNCRVVNDQQSIIDKLPKEQTYISFFCQNPRVSQAILTDWHGFFPQALFKDGQVDFSKNKQFDIGVTEEDNEDENHLEDGQYKTTFKSKEFSTNSSIIGRWSDEIVDDTEDNPIYKVKLQGNPRSIEYVYLTHTS